LKDTRPQHIKHWTNFTDYTKRFVSELEADAVAALAGKHKPDAGIMTPVQTAKLPYDFTPSQICILQHPR
jgi:hypothetical protein